MRSLGSGQLLRWPRHAGHAGHLLPAAQPFTHASRHRTRRLVPAIPAAPRLQLDSQSEAKVSHAPLVGISCRYGHSAPRLHSPRTKNVQILALLRCRQEGSKAWKGVSHCLARQLPPLCPGCCTAAPTTPHAASPAEGSQPTYRIVWLRAPQLHQYLVLLGGLVWVAVQRALRL